MAIPETFRSPKAVTGYVSAALALGAFALTGWSVHSSGELFPHVILLIAVTAAFYACEQFLVDVEFRRQSHSLTFAGVPLVLGIIELPVHEVVLARLVGSLVALVLQRVSLEKLSYNLGAYIFEAALTGTIVQATVATPGGLQLSDLITVLLIVAAVDQMMASLVLGMIRLHGGRLSNQDIAAVLLTSAMLSATSTVFAVAMALLLEHGVIGAVLVCLLVAMAIAVYAMYASTTRRHGSLTTVHEFVVDEQLEAKSTEALARFALTQIRRVLRAAATELVVFDEAVSQEGIDRDLRGQIMTVDEEDRLTIRTCRGVPLDALRVEALAHGGHTIVKRSTKDPRLRRWLADRDIRDAIVAPISHEGTAFGVITVTDRLGATSSFNPSDLEMLRILSSHLSVAWQNAKLVERLGWDATHDGLTKLPNRALLRERIRAQEAVGAHYAVLMMDLDKFKEVNDVLGHAVGDRLLTVVAERLAACVPDDATVARLGGDEFAVLLANQHLGDARGAREVATAIVASLVRPVLFDEATLSPEASIGIALSVTADVEEHDDVLRRADTAMYAAKSDSQHIALYHCDMDRGRAENLALIADLRAALDAHREQFAVYYQPKIDLRSGRVVSAEALVRWLHPTLGVVTPNRFIPLAEATGLISHLATHVLNTATADCARWHAAGHRLSVAVNLSANNLCSDDVETMVEHALSAAGLPAQRLVLEVTESSVMTDPDKAAGVLTRLADRGVRISLDDFGTGYSSLAYLQRLPVGELKIDRSFVSALAEGTSSYAQALITSVITLGRTLGLELVAEGVETEFQQDLLTDLGCHMGQGYLYSRPVDTAEFAAWLKNSDSSLTLVS
jgi:diguanylate cyclase (GGDEF)-like protein